MRQHLLTLSQTVPGFTCLQYKSFKKTLGKEKVAHKEQFLLFPAVFSTNLENFWPFSSNLESVVCKLFEFGKV